MRCRPDPEHSHGHTVSEWKNIRCVQHSTCVLCNYTLITAYIERHLGDVVVKHYNPEDSMEFSNEAKKYMDSLSNKSLASETIGITSRKLNSFKLPTNEIISINLLSNFNQVKINRKSKSLGNFCLMISLVFFLLTYRN